MADFHVPISVLDNRLPGVCVVSGAPTTETKERTAENPVGAAAIAILLGLLGFVIVRMATRRTVTFRLPYHHQAAKRCQTVRTRRHNMLLFVLADIVFFVVCVFVTAAVDDRRPTGTGTPPFVAVLIVLMILSVLAGPTAFLASFEPAFRVVRTTYHPDLRTVSFKHAHPAFVAAMTQTMNQAMAANAAASATQFPGGSPYAAFQLPDANLAPPPSWQRDPTGRAAYRWWNGHTWTEDVIGPDGRQLDHLAG